MTMVLEQERVEPEAAETVRVVLADGGALAEALDALFDEVELSEADDLPGLARALAGPRPPDLVIVDLALPRIGGLPGLLYLRAQNPAVPIAVVSSLADRFPTDWAVMRRVVEAGAAGIVPHDGDAAMLREAIRGLLEGEIWTPPHLANTDMAGLDMTAPLEPDAAEALRRLASLTPQQLRVLTMLARGLLNKQVAYELTVSEATVKAHVSAILQKLGVEGRTQAVAAVCRLEGGRFTRLPAPR